MVGLRFGRLTVIRRDGVMQKRPRTAWLCQCDCGNEKRVTGPVLRQGKVRSCGCLRRDLGRASSTRHGLAYTPTWWSWRSALNRCYYRDPSHDLYYAGRGITVCSRWNPASGGSFENFLADMGERPEGMTLDRIDVNGNYEPGNCRWATYAEQRSNQREA